MDAVFDPDEYKYRSLEGQTTLKYSYEIKLDGRDNGYGLLILYYEVENYSSRFYSSSKTEFARIRYNVDTETGLTTNSQLELLKEAVKGLNGLKQPFYQEGRPHGMAGLVDIAECQTKEEMKQIIQNALGIEEMFWGLTQARERQLFKDMIDVRFDLLKQYAIYTHMGFDVFYEKIIKTLCNEKIKFYLNNDMGPRGRFTTDNCLLEYKSTSEFTIGVALHELTHAYIYLETNSILNIKDDEALGHLVEDIFDYQINELVQVEKILKKEYGNPKEVFSGDENDYDHMWKMRFGSTANIIKIMQTRVKIKATYRDNTKSYWLRPPFTTEYFNPAPYHFSSLKTVLGIDFSTKTVQSYGLLLKSLYPQISNIEFSTPDWWLKEWVF